jgi:hypothetical protein
MARRHSSVRQTIVALIFTPQGNLRLVVLGRGIALFTGLGLARLPIVIIGRPAIRQPTGGRPD